MYEFNIFSVLSLFAAQIYLCLGIYAFSKNPKNKANILFLFVALTMAVWGIGEGMMRAAQNPDIAYFWSKYIIGLGSTIHSAFLVHFWLVFSGGMTKFKKNIPIAFYVVASIFLILRFMGKIVTGVEENYWGYSSAGGHSYELFMLYIVLSTLSVVILAFATARKNIGKIRKQAIYMGIAVALPLALGIVTQALHPFIGIGIPELSVISTIFFIVLIAWTISRYGMLTITTKMVAENVIATMSDLVMVSNKEMKIIFVNDAMLKNLNYKKEEMVDKSLEQILSSEELNNLKYDDLLKELPILNHKANLIAYGDKKVPISANISVVKDAGSAPLGLVFVMRDMREVNELIEKLEKKTQEMETKNTELERFNKAAINRESRIEELKKQLKEKGKKK